MELIYIKGNTFYIKGGTNTGVYLSENNIAFVIDPGLGGLRPKKIIDILQAQNKDLKAIINTHEHNDHYGSCSQFKGHYKDAKIMSSEYAKLYIENPELFSKYILGGKSNIFMDSKFKNKSLDKVKIDQVIKECIIDIEGIELNIIELKGHTPGSIGVLTPDKVFFIGDLLVGDDMLNKYDFLFIFDIEEYLKSLEKLNTIDFDYLVLGHSKSVISKEESYSLIEKHKSCIDKYLNQIIIELEHPIGIDNLLENIIIKNNLSNNYKEYHFFRSSLISIISYLSDLDKIEYLLDDGQLHYYTKKK